MEKNGLIERIVGNDARTKKIVLNSKAQILFQERIKEMQMIEEIVVQGITKEEIEVFSNVLDKMKMNIKKESEKLLKGRRQYDKINKRF